MVTPPAGWTLIRRTNQSSHVGYATYRKLAGASEPANYSFSMTNSPKWSIGSRTGVRSSMFHLT